MKQLRDGRGKSRDSQRSPSLSFSVSLAFLQFNWTIGISNGKYASITEGFNMTAGAWSFQWGLCCADIWYNALREGKLFFGNLKLFIEIQIMLKDLLIFRWFFFDNFDRSELYFFFFQICSMLLDDVLAILEEVGSPGGGVSLPGQV